MSENRNMDGELIEIKPDVVDSAFVSPENDDDIKIAGSEPKETEAAATESTGALEEIQSESEEEVLPEIEIAPELDVEPEPEPDIEEIFGKELYETEHEAEENLMLETVGDSLTRELNSEIENMRMYEKAVAEAQKREEVQRTEDEEPAKPWYARIPVWGYAASAAVILIIAVVLWFRFSAEGQRILIKIGAGYVSEKVNYEPVTDSAPQIPVDEVEDGIPDDAVILPDDIVVATPTAAPEPTEEPAEDENVNDEPEVQKVVNILLLGEEAIGSAGRGRTDLMMLASINTETKTLSLTSLMRDILVSIPGYSDNKLNAAYAIDGVKLLYETLELNFGIRPDNYILVNFDNFASIIDYLGGVDIEISSAEAYYLNTTNYISKVENRTIKEGTNHLNGDQALGYCRIRKVATANHEYMDFGRTSRQRKLLDSLFKRASELGYLELIGMADNCLPMVTTDLTAEDIEKCAAMLFEVGLKTPMAQHRIPVSGTFSEAYLRNMLVTKIDIEANRKALNEFIYGDNSR